MSTSAVVAKTAARVLPAARRSTEFPAAASLLPHGAPLGAIAVLSFGLLGGSLARNARRSKALRLQSPLCFLKALPFLALLMRSPCRQMLPLTAALIGAAAADFSLVLQLPAAPQGHLGSVQQI